MKSQREKKRFYLTGTVVSYQPSLGFFLLGCFLQVLWRSIPHPPKPLTLAGSLLTLFLAPRYMVGPGDLFN